MQIILIILLNFIFFYRTLKYQFISDDVAILSRTEPEPKNTLHRWWLQFRCRRYFNPREVHILNFITHTLNGLLIYFLFGKTNLAFLTAVLFTINPINSQASLWCSGRSYAISTTLTLLMFVFPWFAPGFFYLTKFFSANALLAPFAFVTTKFDFWIILSFIGILLRKKGLEEKSVSSVSEEMRAIAWRKTILFSKTFGYYFTLCLLPLHLGWHHQFIWGIGVTDKYNQQVYKINKDFWYGLCVVLFTLGGILFRIPGAWGLLWFTINISMWCNFMTWQQQIAERFCYLANIGMMFFLGSLLFKIPQPYTYFIMGIVLGGYAVKMWLITRMFQNEYWRIEHSVLERPDAHYAWLYRGWRKATSGNVQGALADFMEARIISPHEFKANFNIASCFIILQQIEKAKEYLKYAEENIYIGEETRIQPAIDKVKKFIEEIEATKVINLTKVMWFC